MLLIYTLLAFANSVAFGGSLDWKHQDVLRYPMMNLFQKNFTNPDFSLADVGEPLYLTPLLKAGRFKEAQKRARVENLSVIPSYSGFFTVNKKYESNIFFWYIPSAVSI